MFKPPIYVSDLFGRSGRFIVGIYDLRLIISETLCGSLMAKAAFTHAVYTRGAFF